MITRQFSHNCGKLNHARSLTKRLSRPTRHRPKGEPFCAFPRGVSWQMGDSRGHNVTPRSCGKIVKARLLFKLESASASRAGSSWMETPTKGSREVSSRALERKAYPGNSFSLSQSENAEYIEHKIFPVLAWTKITWPLSRLNLVNDQSRFENEGVGILENRLGEIHFAKIVFWTEGPTLKLIAKRIESAIGNEQILKCFKTYFSGRI